VENAMNRNKGFTLIELMAVVSILSILLVVALAAYQDYVTRSKTSEGMAFAAEAKTSVSEFYYNRRTMPESNSAAGLAPAGSYNQFKYISTLSVATSAPFGVITVTFKIPGSIANGKEVQLTPDTTDGYITWICEAPIDNGMKVNHLPPNCRG
jgi:type IV pilus assembly protein PilA